MRINVYLRNIGIASRREADTLIAEGKVLVNGTVATPGMQVTEKDTVEVRGYDKDIRVHAYYKPRGLPTQADPGVLSVVTLAKESGLFPIGRLDADSEGLLILTNDGRLTTTLIGTDSAVEKEYEVTVREKLRPGIEHIFARGMETEALGTLRPATFSMMNEHTARVVLHEGKKHQIRVMCAELGYTIETLKRVRVGGVKIGGLRPGEQRPLTDEEMNEWKPAAHQLGSAS